MKDGRTPERRFGEEARRRRLGRGWSQADVAQIMAAQGFPSWRQTTVAKTEAGQRPLRLDEAVALAHSFGSPLQHMITEDPTEVIGAMGEVLALTQQRVGAVEELRVSQQRLLAIERRVRDAYRRLVEAYEKAAADGTTVEGAEVLALDEDMLIRLRRGAEGAGANEQEMASPDDINNPLGITESAEEIEFEPVPEDDVTPDLREENLHRGKHQEAP